MLHWAVAVGNLAAMNALLMAGTDETATTDTSMSFSVAFPVELRQEPAL